MTEDKIPYGRFMTIPKLAREIDVSDATVRRYIKNYPDYFESEEIDGWPQYPVEKTTKLLKRIGEIATAGQRRSEVLHVLEKEFDIVRSEQADFDIPAFHDQVELGPKTLALLERIASALEKIAP